MADEFVEVVKKLWNSWEPDAVVMDEEDGIFVDPEKVHVVDHRGRFFKSRGPLNTVRPPQGLPVLAQAGGSPQGRSFAARHIDVVIAAVSTAQEMKSYRDDLRARLARNGREPDSCKLMFQVIPVFAETDGEAHELLKVRRRAPEVMLASMSSLFDIDLSKVDIDAPLEGLSTNGQQGTFERFMSTGRTLREIVQNFRFGLEDIAGTPESVAARCPI